MASTVGPTVVNDHEAKTHLSKLLARVEAGEEIVIARAGKPIVTMLPVEAPPTREFGFLDLGEIPDDFYAPLTEEELAEWERPT